MALRLRRGTDAERQQITPVEGELIYTTDTKQLWAGDGTTQGGTLVSADAATTLELLTDTDLTGKANDNILAYNSGTAKWQPTDTFNGTVIGDVVGTLTGNVTGTLDGDMTGSVFGDDSTALVDGVNGILNGNIITNNITTDRVRIENPDQAGDGLNGGIGEVNVDVVSNDNRSLLNLRRASTTDLSTDQSAIYGTLTFGREDINGVLTTNILFGREHGFYFGNATDGVFNSSDQFMVWRDHKLGVAKVDPVAELDVNGNAIISGSLTAGSFIGTLTTDDSTIIVDGIDGSITAGSFVQFGSFTTLERDVLTAANGMVIYNTTDNKFQGYENGAWVNLIT